jgi:Ni/Co efflux regulator RcnB
MNNFRHAIVVAAFGLLAAGGALAGEWNHRGHGEDRGRGGPAPRGGERGGYDHRAYEAPRGYDRGPPAVAVGRPIGPDRACGDFAPCRTVRPDYPGYAPGYGPAPRGGWRRGDFLPRSYWTAPELDPRRYRLRTPPPGYGWHGAGRDAYLVQRSTGLILDTVPGVW